MLLARQTGVGFRESLSVRQSRPRSLNERTTELAINLGVLYCIFDANVVQRRSRLTRCLNLKMFRAVGPLLIGAFKDAL
jgi:hypothetical protein